jgi:tetraacyldisaccharide 4'-kinase
LKLFDRISKKLEKRIVKFWESDDSVKLWSVETVLIMLSHIFRSGVQLRSLGFQTGLLPQKKLPCRVISIGNLVAGGAGKTPMTLFVARLLQDSGQKVVVISRGYSGTYEKAVGIVSNGHQLFLDADQAGDEPYMMAVMKRFPVIIGKNRYQAGMTAVRQFNPDVIILDDAFQHRQLERDLDLLLFDYDSPLGNRRLLPAGKLREPFEPALQRADAVIFTRSGPKDSKDAGRVIRSIGKTPWFKAVHAPFLAAVKTGDAKTTQEIKDLNSLKGKSAVLFSGLANNPSFHRTVSALGVNILDHLEFKDHYRYKRADIININQTARNKGAQIILTTQKDGVKIDKESGWEMDLGIIGIEIRLENSGQFAAFINGKRHHP